MTWRNSINENIDASEIPIMLIENKADLIPDYSKTNEEFINFSHKNKFSVCFRTSAKTGLNINESMDFFINLVVKNMEENAKLFTNERNQSIVLDRTLVNEKSKMRKNNCC